MPLQVACTVVFVPIEIYLWVCTLPNVIVRVPQNSSANDFIYLNPKKEGPCHPLDNNQNVYPMSTRCFYCMRKEGLRANHKTSLSPVRKSRPCFILWYDMLDYTKIKQHDHKHAIMVLGVETRCFSQGPFPSDCPSLSSPRIENVSKKEFE